MKHTPAGIPLSLAAAGALLFTCGASQKAAAADPPSAPAARAALVGGALPGGAVISAAVSGQSVALVPVAGGNATLTPLAADGSFRAIGLASGHYQLSVRSLSVAKQTQQASFGEKVQSGLAQTGAALAQGKVGNGNMPSRISMNVTVGRQTVPAEIDGAPIDVEVGSDGVLTGKVAAR